MTIKERLTYLIRYHKNLTLQLEHLSNQETLIDQITRVEDEIEKLLFEDWATQA